MAEAQFEERGRNNEDLEQLLAIIGQRVEQRDGYQDWNQPRTQYGTSDSPRAARPTENGSQEQQTEPHRTQSKSIARPTENGSQEQQTEPHRTQSKSIASKKKPRPNKKKHTDPKKHTCQICNKTYVKIYSLQLHMEAEHEGKKHTCYVCGLTTKWETNLRIHLRRLHNIGEEPLKKEIRRQCDICKKTFPSNALMLKHLSVVHNITEPFKCSCCPKRFKNQMNMSNHKLQHAELVRYRCSVCNLRFQMYSYFIAHCEKYGHNNTQENLRDIDDLSCIKCPKTWQTGEGKYTNFEMHMRDALTIGCFLPDIEPFCQVCRKTFITMKQLRRHFAAEHRNVLTKSSGGRHPRKNKIKKKPPPSKEKCRVCGKMVSSNVQTMKYHLHWHEGRKDFKCDKCDFATSFPSALREHIKKRHVGKKRHNCQVCHEGFNNKRQYLEHVYTHKDTPPPKCSGCGKECLSDWVYGNHLHTCKEWKMLPKSQTKDAEEKICEKYRQYSKAQSRKNMAKKKAKLTGAEFNEEEFEQQDKERMQRKLARRAGLSMADGTSEDSNRQKQEEEQSCAGATSELAKESEDHCKVTSKENERVDEGSVCKTNSEIHVGAEKSNLKETVIAVDSKSSNNSKGHVDDDDKQGTEFKPNVGERVSKGVQGRDNRKSKQKVQQTKRADTLKKSHRKSTQKSGGCKRRNVKMTSLMKRKYNNQNRVEYMDIEDSNGKMTGIKLCRDGKSTERRKNVHRRVKTLKMRSCKKEAGDLQSEEDMSSNVVSESDGDSDWKPTQSDGDVVNDSSDDNDDGIISESNDGEEDDSFDFKQITSDDEVVFDESASSWQSPECEDDKYGDSTALSNIHKKEKTKKLPKLKKVHIKDEARHVKQEQDSDWQASDRSYVHNREANEQRRRRAHKRVTTTRVQNYVEEDSKASDTDVHNHEDIEMSRRSTRKNVKTTRMQNYEEESSEKQASDTDVHNHDEIENSRRSVRKRVKTTKMQAYEEEGGRQEHVVGSDRNIKNIEPFSEWARIKISRKMRNSILKSNPQVLLVKLPQFMQSLTFGDTDDDIELMEVSWNDQNQILCSEASGYTGDDDNMDISQAGRPCELSVNSFVGSMGRSIKEERDAEVMGYHLLDQDDAMPQSPWVQNSSKYDEEEDDDEIESNLDEDVFDAVVFS